MADEHHPAQAGHTKTPRLARGVSTLFAAFFATWAAVLALHLPLLRLPYYWDEAGYYIPAARDFLLHGTLIPVSTLTNAHPPLPSLLLAAAWRIFGFHPAVTRATVSAVAAVALLAVYRFARAFAGRRVAAATALLTALYPIWFVQSTLAHADIFAAALTLSALALFAHRGRPGVGSVLLLCAAALAKETAIVTPLALFLWSVFCFARARHNRDLRDAAAWAVPALPLAAWYAYHRARTGFMFGNPEYLRYNATSNFHAARIVFALTARAWHLLGHMNLWVPLLITLALWAFAKRVPNDAVTKASPHLERPGPAGPSTSRAAARHRFGRDDSALSASGGSEKSRRQVIGALATVFALNVLFFSVAGGALLTRYLLPLYPMVLLLHLHFWSRRLRAWWIPAAVTAAAFILGWTVNPPYGFAAEDNLSYRDVIVLTQQAIAQLPRPGSDIRVLSAWPVTDDLTKPELGYVDTPYSVLALKDLSAAALVNRPQDQPYTHAIVFPSGPEPQHRIFQLGGGARQANASYFGAHENVDPATAARLLGLGVAWQQRAGGEWAAVLSAPQPVLDAGMVRKSLRASHLPARPGF